MSKEAKLELAAEIAVKWVSARPSCTPEQVGALYSGALAAAKQLLESAEQAATAEQQAEKDAEALKLFTEARAQQEAKDQAEAEERAREAAAQGGEVTP